MIHCHTSDYSLDMMYSTTRECVCGGGGHTCYLHLVLYPHKNIHRGYYDLVQRPEMFTAYTRERIDETWEMRSKISTV